MSGEKPSIQIQDRFFITSQFYLDKKGIPQEKWCKVFVKGKDKQGNEFNLGKLKFNMAEFVNQTNVPVKAMLSEPAIEESSISFTLSISHADDIEKNEMFVSNNDHLDTRKQTWVP